MFRLKKRIAESQPGRDLVGVQKSFDLFRIIIAEADPASAPDTVTWRSVNGPDLAPIVEPVPVGIEDGKEDFIKIVKLKEARQVEKSLRLNSR